ncbi:YcgJ family protein [Ensifer sp. ENS11]|uniref:YcgJ family protein n=1 Tax=Ensifer sp. ENS11 TaxID=2769291 RepID=UPI00178078A6|nr:YcgJ family protein [Ensifer sp. ENS11]MBD9488191.1 hypothetical protein [Ensifer sp. ENS11]
MRARKRLLPPPGCSVWKPSSAGGLRSPEKGVLCDRYMCADNTGVSRRLTQKHLGKKAAIKLFSQGDFDQAEFTFANGIFRDVKERLCREDRYFDADSKRSATITRTYTRLQFRR